MRHGMQATFQNHTGRASWSGPLVLQPVYKGGGNQQHPFILKRGRQTRLWRAEGRLYIWNLGSRWEKVANTETGCLQWVRTCTESHVRLRILEPAVVFQCFVLLLTKCYHVLLLTPWAIFESTASYPNLLPRRAHPQDPVLEAGPRFWIWHKISWVSQVWSESSSCHWNVWGHVAPLPKISQCLPVAFRRIPKLLAMPDRALHWCGPCPPLWPLPWPPPTLTWTSHAGHPPLPWTHTSSHFALAPPSVGNVLPLPVLPLRSQQWRYLLGDVFSDPRSIEAAFLSLSLTFFIFFCSFIYLLSLSL